jgi:hypothetical protein
MWRSCSAHIQHDKYLISVHRLKYPLLPSGNSTLQVWRAGRDLHRLASFTRRAHVRFYSSHTPVAAERDLVRSDAQRKTIYALSTPPGKAGVAVVRISGPDALDVWQKMVKPYPATKNKGTHPEPWKMERCRITDPQTHEILDDGLAVFFKGKSFMGIYISFSTHDSSSSEIIHNARCTGIPSSLRSRHNIVRSTFPLSPAFVSASGSRRVYPTRL